MDSGASHQITPSAHSQPPFSRRTVISVSENQEQDPHARGRHHPLTLRSGCVALAGANHLAGPGPGGRAAADAKDVRAGSTRASRKPLLLTDLSDHAAHSDPQQAVACRTPTGCSRTRSTRRRSSRRPHRSPGCRKVDDLEVRGVHEAVRPVRPRARPHRLRLPR